MMSFWIILWSLVTLLMIVSTLLQEEVSTLAKLEKKRFGLVVSIPVIAIIILIFVVLSFATSHFMRLSHAIFVLGLWLSAFLSFLMLKANGVHRLINVIRICLTAIPAIYVTDITHFQHVFSSLTDSYPLLFGLLLITSFYLTIFKIRQANRHFD